MLAAAQPTLEQPNGVNVKLQNCWFMNFFFCWCLLTLPEAVRTFCHAAESVNADPEIQNIPSDTPIIPTNAPCCQTQTTHDGDPGGIGGERNDLILKNKQKEV